MPWMKYQELVKVFRKSVENDLYYLGGLKGRLLLVAVTDLLEQHLPVDLVRLTDVVFVDR